MTAKKRSVPFKGCNGRLETISRTGSTNVFTGGWAPPNAQGTQVTVSENHPEWRRRKPSSGFTSDIGGSFTSTKTYAECLPEARRVYSIWVHTGPGAGDGTVIKYDGPITAIGAIPAGFAPSLASSDSTLDAWGAKAIEACKPTNSAADASIFIGEIFRGGIPDMIGSTLWKSKTRSALKKGSNEYLNLEFGWKPIARDIQKFYSGVTNADAILRQYERDANRVVRRRYDFPPEESETSMKWQTDAAEHINPSTGLQYKYPPVRGEIIRVHKKYVKRWFSGAFVYHIPAYKSEVLTRRARLSKHVLGLELTPEVIWNLAPWTWATDWVSSLGSVVSNASDYATDGLVLRYGYIMEHSVSSYSYIYSGPSALRSAPSPSIVRLTTEVKRRRKATPFGFGLTWNDFSSRQKAIAAALGISRS